MFYFHFRNPIMSHLVILIVAKILLILLSVKQLSIFIAFLFVNCTISFLYNSYQKYCQLV